MTSTLRPIGRASLVVLMLIAFGLVPSVEAQPSTSGPVVTLDRTEIKPGEYVVLTIDGFAASSVTISVCGNEARRGSADCNMTASEGLRLDGAGISTVAKIPVAAPPVACPCVIRVSSRTNDEVAVTPIVLVGHPVGPVVDGPSLVDPLDVTISARIASAGLLEWVRPSLGGPTTYDVTVTVKNRSTVPLHHVRVSGSVGRSANGNLVTLDLVDPGEIGVGQTWRQIMSAVVPAPSLGSVEWRVAVSGAGPTVTATDTTRHRPVLLLVLATLLVVVVTLLAMRFAVRRRAARDATRADDVSDDGHVSASTSIPPTSSVEAPPPGRRAS